MEQLTRQILVSFFFLLTSFLVVFLVIKKPFIKLKIKNKIHYIDTYFLGALIGPILLFLFSLLSFDSMIDGLFSSGAVNPIRILVLFLSMVFISIFLDKVGFFAYCALLALSIAKKSQKALFISLYATVSLLTIFTSNDIIILTFTPFIYYFAREAKINPIPYLVGEFVAANALSMMLYIGNPTNIYLASAYNIGFFEFTKWTFFPTIVCGLVCFFSVYFIFRKELSKPLFHKHHIVPKDAIKDKVGVFAGVFCMVFCILSLAIAPYFGIEMWFISFLFAFCLFWFIYLREIIHTFGMIHDNRKKFYLFDSLKSMPFAIIPFVISMFIMVIALKEQGVTKIIGDFFLSFAGTSTTGNIFFYGFVSSLTCNIINNIPMTVLFESVLLSLSGTVQTASVYATIIGSNLGAIFTPIGALAGIMWMSILKEKHISFSFIDFVKYGFFVAVLSIASTLAVLALEFALFA